ncbi:MAG: virulence factor [Phenylobacterium sp.]|uniref:AcvB/VirJ family lysyl-phosphatidylglycerol hydrolase n=1 Tax=Phenylobacterium sp. TaxID=1871053 RepID=UPI001A51CCC2|nr:AcvB/VirJ family lysyl-phosphatidylglycerol hydrolase [Phenylobacterium sp.]MBL8555877.1 virulence factor [Phenylobacterium sp.]
MRIAILAAVAAAVIAATGAVAGPAWLNHGDAPAVADAAVAPGDTLAVIYSGDGGWGPLDERLAQGLARRGVPVVGYSSPLYFWTARTPQRAAADLAATLRRQMGAWNRRRVMLIGYSFGADALPAIVPHLPADLRDRVRLVALIGLGPRGELSFRPTSWLGRPSPGAFATAPAVAAMKGWPMLCVYGTGERASACPALPPELIHRVALAGGHHFDGHYDALTRAILDNLPP